MNRPEQTQSELQAMLASARQTHAYKLEGAKMDFTEDVVRLLELHGLSQTELAKRIDASPAYITKILRGNTNFTLDTMVKVATALDADLRCHLQPKGTQTIWIDYLVAHLRQQSLSVPVPEEFCGSQFKLTEVPAGRNEDLSYESAPLAA